jgi:RNA polymerase sigma-70 factor (ECF subfamily)
MEESFSDPDRILVQACLEGREDAWESMVGLYGKRIFNICLRFERNIEEAEDLTQEIFVRIYRSLKSFRYDSGSFQCWIFSIARNLAIDHYRKKGRMQPLLGSQVMETLHLEDDRTPSPSAALEHSEARRYLSQALIELSPVLRNALILRDLHGMSYQQVAMATGVTEGTVKSRVFRARLHLSKIIMDREDTRRGFPRCLPLRGLSGNRALAGLPVPAANPS